MSEPQIASREAQPYLGIRAPVTDGIRSFADSAFPELFGWLTSHGVAPAGPPFLRYYEVARDGEPLDVEAGVPVESAADDDVGANESSSGDDRVRASSLPAGDYLTLLHVGPYRSDSLPDLGDARAALVAWADDNEVVYGRETPRGLELSCALEQFQVGPVDEEDFTKWRTEFAYLIRPRT
jgi:effector-binding domain-containing protein